MSHPKRFPGMGGALPSVRRSPQQMGAEHAEPLGGWTGAWPAKVKKSWRKKLRQHARHQIREQIG